MRDELVLVEAIAVGVCGWLAFHRAGTTRVPGQVSSTFESWGPYRVTRNPMYVGLSLAYLERRRSFARFGRQFCSR